jgi:hypothetical protein
VIAVDFEHAARLLMSIELMIALQNVWLNDNVDCSLYAIRLNGTHMRSELVS